MKKIRRLVISGYSFGDKGINLVLSRWMRDDSTSEMLVLHANKEDQALIGARGAISKLLNDYPQRITVHPAYLSACDWQALRAKLNPKLRK